jgi:hypothetical protein
MTDRGWLELRETIYRRQSWQREWHGRIQQVVLTDPQQEALTAIRQAMRFGATQKKAGYARQKQSTLIL